MACAVLLFLVHEPSVRYQLKTQALKTQAHYTEQNKKESQPQVSPPSRA